MKIVIGLGNPGTKYTKTRHNVGFMVIDKFLKGCNVSFTKKYCDSIINKWFFEGEEVLFVKPQLFMNLSGVPTKKIVEKNGCNLNEILVILDDVNLPLGRIRIREKGSSSGNTSSENTKDFVLSRFTREEKDVIEDALDKACNAIRYWITRDINNCMSMINQEGKQS